MFWQLGLLLFSFGSLIVLYIVPHLAIYFQIDEIIYPTDFRSDFLWANLLICMVPFILSLKKIDIRKTYLKPKIIPDLYFFPLLVLFWIFLIIFFGGFSYRINDVLYGYESRGFLVDSLLSLTSIITVSLCVILLRIEKFSIFEKVFFSLIALLFISIQILNGSRGYLLIFLLTVFLSRLLLNLFLKNKNKPISVLTIISKNFRVRYFIIFLLIIYIFSLWGVARAQTEGFGFSGELQSVPLFALIFRLSEPYWAYSLSVFNESGLNFDILVGSFERILSIPGRLVGFNYDFSIAGNNFLIDKYLGIPFREGVSLPITLAGEGFLFNGFLGAIFYYFMASLMIIAIFKLLEFLLKIDLYIYIVFIAATVVKCFLLYSQSLSGVFLVLFYETFRDLFLLFFIILPFHILNNKAIVAKGP